MTQQGEEEDEQAGEEAGEESAPHGGWESEGEDHMDHFTLAFFAGGRASHKMNLPDFPTRRINPCDSRNTSRLLMALRVTPSSWRLRIDVSMF